MFTLKYQVKDYLQGDNEYRLAHATALLENKAAHRYVRNYNIAFEQLRDESIEHRLANYKPSANARSIERFDVKGINSALREDPKSYGYIFGEITDKKAKTTRYGEYTVSHLGKYKGMWWDKTKERYAEPLEAIKQVYGKDINGLTHYEYGAMLAGIPLEKAKIREVIDTDLTDLKRLWEERQEIKEKVQQCENLWSKTEALEGSVAEQYLHEHRGIKSIDGLNMRCLPVGAYSYIDEEGNTKTNKLPMLVVPGYDRFNRLRSLQRIYLDPKNANKASFMDSPKLSMGVISGTGGLIQKGDSGRVYIVEGPETGASIANADPKATVYASFGVHNIAKMGGLIEKGKYDEVIIAADNDGVGSNAEKLTIEAQAELAKKGIKATIITPKALEGKSKTDWNDIHQAFGVMSVRRHLPYFKKEQAQQVWMHHFAHYIDQRAKAGLGNGDEIVNGFYAKHQDKVDTLAKAYTDREVKMTASDLQQGKLDIKNRKITEQAQKAMMYISKSIKDRLEIEKRFEKSKSLSKGKDNGIDI